MKTASNEVSRWTFLLLRLIFLPLLLSVTSPDWTLVPRNKDGGICASYNLTDKWSITGGITCGWDQAFEDNNCRAERFHDDDRPRTGLSKSWPRFRL